MKIVTNSQEPGEPKDWKDNTLFSIYSSFAGDDQIQDLKSKYEDGIGWGDAKNILFYDLNKLLMPIRERYEDLKTQEAHVEEILQENAKKVAEFLSKFKNIKLLYPYKKDSYNFRMWKKYYSGASGLMGLKIKCKNINSVRKFVNSLKLFGYGYSWGGFESLALHQEYRETGNRKFLKLAKDEHLVRLHIGLEDPKDLIADLKKALKFIK